MKEVSNWFGQNSYYTGGAATTEAAKNSYDGSGSVWSMIPSGLMGVASVIASLKGNPATVTNVIPGGGAPQNNGMSPILLIGGGVLMLIVLLFVFTKK